MKKVLGLIMTIAIISSSLIGCAGADFEVGPVDIPQYVLTGAPITIYTDISNIGTAEGTYTARLKLDGVEIDSTEITLEAGASEEISLTFDVDEPGTHTLNINGITVEVTALAPEEIITRVKESSKEVKTIQANRPCRNGLRMWRL